MELNYATVNFNKYNYNWNGIYDILIKNVFKYYTYVSNMREDINFSLSSTW